MKRRTIIVITAIAVAVVATGGFMMNKGKGNKAQEVETTTAKRAKIVQKVNGTGRA